MQNSITQYISAVGALGTAAYGLVDASKLVRGGPSNHGFGFIKKAIGTLFEGSKSSSGLSVEGLNGVLRSNWLNGVQLDDQKAKAKSLIKLMLNDGTAQSLSRATGLSEEILKSIATAMHGNGQFDASLTDALGRFDLALTALLDEAYQRADQQYRNSVKGWATAVSILLAVAGGWILAEQDPGLEVAYWFTDRFWLSFFCGVLATPLAPVAKDLSSALNAAVQTIQFSKTRRS